MRFFEAMAAMGMINQGGASAEQISTAVNAYLAANPPAAYTLPVATQAKLGGVMPVAATEEMTQDVGVTEEGRLVTKPGGSGSGISVTGAAAGQIVKIAAVDDNGVPTAWEAVNMPSGGGEDSSVTPEWITLATGTLAAETASGTVTDTGITYGELNQYKMFEVVIHGSTNTSTTFGLAPSENTASWTWITFTNGGRGKLIAAKIKDGYWCGGVRSNQNVSLASIANKDPHIYQVFTGIHLDHILDFSALTETTIKIANSGVVSVDVNWTIQGLVY